MKNQGETPAGEDPGQLRLKRLLCKRTGQQYTLERHERCPYCWGDRQRIERGRHEDFCDYDPERDPLHFGFPRARRATAPA